jgi:hypothetical protein
MYFKFNNLIGMEKMTNVDLCPIVTIFLKKHI